MTPGHGPRKARPLLPRRAQTARPAGACPDRTASARAEIRGGRLRRLGDLLRRVPKTGADRDNPLFERPDLVEDDYYRLRTGPTADEGGSCIQACPPRPHGQQLIDRFRRRCQSGQSRGTPAGERDRLLLEARWARWLEAPSANRPGSRAWKTIPSLARIGTADRVIGTAG